MTDRDERQDISQETSHLIDRLGDRLAREPGADQVAFLQADMAGPSRLSPDDDEWLIRDKLDDVEAEIRAASRPPVDESHLQYLHEMRDILLRDLNLAPQRGSWQRRPLRARPESAYLATIGVAARKMIPGYFWLYGDDARERARASLWIEEILMSPRLSRTIVEVDFRRRHGPSSSPDSLLAYAIREAWGSDEDRRPGLSEPLEYLAERNRRRSPGLAVILNDFPGGRANARLFLDWLREQLSSASALMFIVITERPPRDPSDFYVIECIGAAARVGRRIAELRVTRGWNRADLARAARLDEAYLAEAEGGLIELGPKQLAFVAAELGVPVEDLTGRDERRRR